MCCLLQWGLLYKKNGYIKIKENLKQMQQLGQGGTFDYEAGKIKRAPKLFQKLGIEWFWRLCREPKRIVRMTVLPVYLIKIILKKDKTKGNFE